MMGGPGGPLGHGPEDSGKRLMSFKEFILAQSNDINEQEALVRYSDYKTDFTRRQIDKFFKEHQDEEWFRNRYRPTEIKKIQEAVKESRIKRKELYNKLVEKHSIDEISLDVDHIESLSRFLDKFSLLLEGATMEDLDDPESRRKFGVSTVYLPVIHQSIDRAMIEQFASQSPEYLRLAMGDAMPDKEYKRRAWITYKQMKPDDIRQTCWTFNNQKFNGQETRAVVNKEMNNCVKPTQYWFCHTKCARADLKNVSKLLNYFEGEDCPLLEVIKDYLIEESNEEEKLLGINEQNVPTFDFSQDKELFKALDKVILYLRCVHSYDYYACTEYSSEDDMPQKLGVMFVRPRLPEIFGENPEMILKEFIQAQQIRIDSFLEKPTLSETEQKQLGKRNSQEEVENFIYQHTFEKKPGEKYVCKITKKKFTAPEYVRKHIFTRCGDKLDEVRTEVEFFNNYVADPKRPM